MRTSGDPKAMRTSGDLFPRPVTSVDEVLAIAHALACEAEVRYRSLAERRRMSGDVELTHLFEQLAENAGRHVAQVVQRSRSLRGHAPDLALVRQQLPRHVDEETMHSALLTPYQALANAVIDEERAFAFHTYLAAQAPEGPVRRLAEELATEKLDHAALLRPERRRAFHTRRPRTASLPRTVVELHALASQWDALAARVHAALARRLADAGDPRRAEIFRRLANDEAQEDAGGLAERRTAGAETVAGGAWRLERTFERYDDMAEKAECEPLMDAPKRLTDRNRRRPEILRHLIEYESQADADEFGERRTAGAETAAEGIRILEQAFERYAGIAAKAGSEPLMAAAQRLTERALRRLVLACSAREAAPAALS